MTAAGPGGFGRVIARAFPGSLADDAQACADIVPAARLVPAGEFAVRAGEENLILPYRIYNDEPDPRALAGLAPRARHHDGYLRQLHLEQIIIAVDPWVVPYVVQLAGEYVAEITAVIETALAELAVPGSPQQAACGRFAAQNPGFIQLTQARAVSYWNQYYRHQYRSLASYPACGLLAKVMEAGREYASGAAS